MLIIKRYSIPVMAENYFANYCQANDCPVSIQWITDVKTIFFTHHDQETYVALDP